MYTVNDSVSERHDLSVRDRYLCLIYTYLCVRETSSPGFDGLSGLYVTYTFAGRRHA